MDPERPPELDAEYKVIHGPWPRWVLQLSLLKLALRTAGIVAVLCLAVVLIFVAVARFGH
jgi:hypothetical protein